MACPSGRLGSSARMGASAKSASRASGLVLVDLDRLGMRSGVTGSHRRASATTAKIDGYKIPAIGPMMRLTITPLIGKGVP
jgi:hypothetical protein